ncbi:MAG TPA: alpha/beta hydrolase [Microvirga sp.]|jgi:pimeloyl-ACP methyl ester carboxylesterase|nr:alpha/beta hydrolase [Microvirga sp.]
MTTQALLDTLAVPATSSRRTVNGIALHVVEAGPAGGPLVILLHGFPEFWWGWRRQIAALAEAGCRVVVPDQRGYNLSDKPRGVRAYGLDRLAADVVALADACGRRTFHVVGHDWGGLVAWWVATRHPERVERLGILNAPHPEVVGPYARAHPSQARKSAYVAWFQLPWLPEWSLARRGFAALRRALRGSSRRGTFPDADLAVYDAAWAQAGALTGMLNWYRALRHRPSAPGVRIAAPTLLIWGEGDLFLERGLAEASLALCDRGEAAWFETATHWVHLEEAEAVNARLVAFLTRS